MPQEFDVFISYSSSDHAWVENLRNTLSSKGIRVWLDKDQIRPGDLFIDALETGIASSKCVALVVSLNSSRSGWVKEEYHRALALRTQLRLIPLLLTDTELPGFLASRKWIDFRDPEQFDQRIEELHWGITGDHSAQQDSSLITQPLPANSLRQRLAPLIVAVSLTVVTGIVFRLWGQDQRAALGAVEYLVVLAFWSVAALTASWAWRLFRSRK